MKSKLKSILTTILLWNLYTKQVLIVICFSCLIRSDVNRSFFNHASMLCPVHTTLISCNITSCFISVTVPFKESTFVDSFSSLNDFARFPINYSFLEYLILPFQFLVFIASFYFRTILFILHGGNHSFLKCLFVQSKNRYLYHKIHCYFNFNDFALIFSNHHHFAKNCPKPCCYYNCPIKL